MQSSRSPRGEQSSRRVPSRSSPPEYDNEVHGRKDADLGRPDASYPPIHATDHPADIVIPRLSKVSGFGPDWSACCPAHPDFHPSLSVTETADGTLLVYCHAGCKVDAIMAAIGLDLSFLFPSPFAQKFGDRKGRGRLTGLRGWATDPASEPVVDHKVYRTILGRARQGAGPKVHELAASLGLPDLSLKALRVGYLDGRWVFAERDGLGRPVGIVYRTPEGGKHCEPGSHRGLTIPRGGDVLPGPIYLAEGATDTAALHSVGACAIGRPAAIASRTVKLWLCQYLADLGDRDVIVVGDRDPERSGLSTGAVGAEWLAQDLRPRLGRPVGWALPQCPYKDVREQIVAGGWQMGLSIEEAPR